MASTKTYLTFILEQLDTLDNITYRAMMGEYIIYYKGKIAAYLCDDRLLVKVVPFSQDFMPDASLEPPYAGAKDMLLVDEVDNKQFLHELFEGMYEQLPMPKPKKKKVNNK